jgi:hypothetical protein
MDKWDNLSSEERQAWRDAATEAYGPRYPAYDHHKFVTGMIAKQNKKKHTY